MKNIYKLGKTLYSILLHSSFFLLTCSFWMCSLLNEKQTYQISSSDKSRMSQVFEQFQIIGEGTDFLTIKCDVPQILSPELSIHALMLDKDGYPLRKVSGYTYDPQLKQRNHVWFYFFLYAPRKAFHFPLESKYIKFIVSKGKNIEMQKIVKIHKTWSSTSQAKIFDLPAPPDQITGYLILRDYTFLAKGDFRKPQGYYVEGMIIGQQGRWVHFVPLSTVLGKKEPVSEDIFSVDQGWLELSNGRTHSMNEAVSPIEPYIEGWWDAKGYFYPRPLKLHGLKKELKN